MVNKFYIFLSESEYCCANDFENSKNFMHGLFFHFEWHCFYMSKSN